MLDALDEKKLKPKRERKTPKVREPKVPKYIDPEHRQAIERIIHLVGTAESATAIKSLCPPAVTLAEIKQILSFMKKK
jgi:hypothetical protein